MLCEVTNQYNQFLSLKRKRTKKEKRNQNQKKTTNLNHKEIKNKQETINPNQKDTIIIPPKQKKNKQTKKKTQNLNLLLKIKNSNLLKKIVSYLGMAENVNLMQYINNTKIKTVSTLEVASLIQQQILPQKQTFHYFGNFLSLTNRRNLLEIFFENFKKKDIRVSFQFKKKFFIYNKNTKTHYILCNQSRLFIQNSINNKVRFIALPFPYVSHFQLLENYNRNIIALFCLNEMHLFDIEKVETVKTFAFSCDFVLYNKAFRIIILLSDIDGTVLLNYDNDERKKISLFKNEVNCVDISEYDRHYCAFYSTDEKDKPDIKIINICTRIEWIKIENDLPIQGVYTIDNRIIIIDKKRITFWNIDNIDNKKIFNIKTLRTFAPSVQINKVDFVPGYIQNCFIFCYTVKDNENLLFGMLILDYVNGKYKVIKLNNVFLDLKEVEFYYCRMKRNQENLPKIIIYSTNSSIDKANDLKESSFEFNELNI